jgi:hypothetical protein
MQQWIIEKVNTWMLIFFVEEMQSKSCEKIPNHQIINPELIVRIHNGPNGPWVREIKILDLENI